MDEINAVCPGYIKIDVTEVEGKLEYKHNHDLSTYTQLEKDEYEIGQLYANCIKEEMERAENEIFERFLDSDLPGKSEISVSRFWLH